MARDIARYVEGYDMCQQMKNRTKKIAGKLKLSEMPRKPWMHITVDFITKKLPIMARKDAILVVCNQLSKMIHFITTTEETLAKSLVRLFRDNM